MGATTILRRVSTAIAVPLAIIGLTGCPAQSVARDRADRTPPALVLAASRPSDAALVTVADGATISVVRGTDVTLLATASDPGGVGDVELWVVPTKRCASVGVGVHGLSIAPVAVTTGRLTATEAPAQLTTTYTLSADVPPDCTVTYEVGARASNAADRPVQTPFTSARFVVPSGG
jgi:hypothetical protein